MNQQRKIEIWVGLFVIMTLIALAVIAFKVSNYQGLKERPSYHISALFMNIGGLKVRAPVKISGVVVGRVEAISIDPKTFQAKVDMRIDSQYNDLPDDTSGSILTSGLLGDQYVGLDPGADDEVLVDGSQLEMTQPALVLENLIGKFLSSMSDKK